MCKKVNALVAAVIMACVMVFSNSAMAQGISIGPRIGMNVAKVSGLDVSSSDSVFGAASMKSGSLAGFVLGAVVNIGVNEMFSIQPEILFSQQGVKQEASGDIFGIPFSAIASTRLNYIQIPVLAKIAFGPENVKGFITAGPSLGYLLGGSITAKTSVFGMEQETSQNLTDSQLDQLNRMDVGLSLGAGGEIGAGPGKLNLDLRYIIGFSDINKLDGPKPDNYEAAKNGVFMVSLAYLFGLGN